MTAPSDFNSIPELDATLVFRVAYDGSSYSGFAEQPGQTTVAGELRRAIETLLRRPIDLTCAGRTDAGVHAVAQYISVPVTDAELALTRRRWLRAMDALLPKDIAINEVYKARKGFSARFDARSRTYTYRIADRDARPVLSRGAVWWHRYPLDVDAMSAACPALLGEQDFKSFCKVASAVGKPTHRCVMRAEFGHEVAFGEDILTFTIEGNAFLHSMVRTIECRNALPSIVKVKMSSPKATSWPNSARITQRCVGLPTAEATLQKLLKSCSPKSAGQAADIASTSKG